MSGIGPTLGGVAATAAGEALNRSDTPTTVEDLRSVATVASAALPLAEKMVPPTAAPKLGLPGKAFSFLGMMEGLYGAFKGGSGMVSSFGKTGPEASNQAHAQAWDKAISEGKSLEEAAAAGSAARTRVLDEGWAGMRSHGADTLGGLWKAGTNAADLAAPVPVGTGADIYAKVTITGLTGLAARPEAEQRAFFLKAFDPFD